MPETVMITTPNCPMCGKPSEVAVEGLGYRQWKAGKLIQNALPGLTTDERELLKTGSHPECWEKIFKGDE